MRRPVPTVLAALILAVLSGCATPVAAGDQPTIPDSVLLGPEDFGGVAPVDGGPDAIHPLPPWPCAQPPTPPPVADRTINAVFARYHAYEYVARYPAGQARAALAALRDQLSRCAVPVAGERYQVVREEASGVLFLRDFDDETKTAAYFVAATDEYLIAVMEIGTRVASGDPTTTVDLGRRAVTRAGGTPGQPVPPTTPAGPVRWSTYEAEVSGVRPGPDARSLLIDVQLPAGHRDCGRDPAITYYTEENGRIYANVVFQSARGEVVGGCPTGEPAVVTLRSTTPIGDREIVLNNAAWGSAASGYRRR